VTSGGAAAEVRIRVSEHERRPAGLDLGVPDRKSSLNPVLPVVLLRGRRSMIGREGSLCRFRRSTSPGGPVGQSASTS